MTLIQRLEKTANEALVEPEYNQYIEQAREGAMEGATTGALAGGAAGTLAGLNEARGSGALGRIGVPLAYGITGAVAGSTLGGVVGKEVGEVTGHMDDYAAQEEYENALAAQARQGSGSVSHAEAGEDKSASELLERLEKTAKEENEGRLDRKLSTEMLMGAGALGHYAKKNNTLGVKESDSHAQANAKVQGGAYGSIGAGIGGTIGALAGKAHGKSALLSGLAGAGVGGASMGGLGAANGYAIGKQHDMWDDRHREEQVAQEIYDFLEKQAGPTDFLRSVSGKGVRDAEKSLAVQKAKPRPGMNAGGYDDALKKKEEAVAAEKSKRSKTRKQTGIGAGATAGVGAGGAGINAAMNSQEKEASELLERLEKTAREENYSVWDETKDGAVSYGKFGAGLGGAIGGIGGAVGGGSVAGPAGAVGGALLGGALGAAGGVTGAVIPGAFSGAGSGLAHRYADVEKAEDQSHMNNEAKISAGISGGLGAAQGALVGASKSGLGGALAGTIGGGAMGAGGGAILGALRGRHKDKREAQEEQLAYEIYDFLEKEAGPKDFVKNVFGRNQSDLKKDIKGVKNSGMYDDEAKERVLKTHNDLLKGEKKKSNKARLQAGAGSAAISGAAAGGKALQNKEQEEQLAYEIQDFLNKEAGVGSALKNFGQNLTGKNQEGLKRTVKHLDNPNTPEWSKGQNADLKKHYQGKLDAEKAKTTKARLQAGGAVAATGAATAGANAFSNEEKTASDEFMNDLFKEAASAIIDEEFPETKAYTDPMDRISFSR